MPAPPLQNNLEAIPNGTTISAANSGGDSGNAFSTATVGAGSQLVASNEHAAHGTTAMKILSPAASPLATRVDWTGLGSITTSVWFRLYFWQMNNPIGPRFIIGFRDAATGALSAQLRIGQPTNNIRVDNAAAATITALDSTLTIPVKTWIRLECRILSSTTVGEFEWRLYLNPYAAVGEYNETKSATGQALAANTDSVRWGMVTNAIASDLTYFDEIAVSTTDWIGPATLANFCPPYPARRMPLGV